MKNTTLQSAVETLHRAAAGGGGDVAYTMAGAERAALAITRTKAFAREGLAGLRPSTQARLEALLTYAAQRRLAK